jgi:hypothetical protein
MAYEELITEILYLAAERFGMPFDPLIPAPSSVRRREAAAVKRSAPSLTRVHPGG